MFKCPVCRHATFNFYQYTIKSGVSTVQCSNCHTVLHQPPRLRNALAALPILLAPLPRYLGLPASRGLDVIWFGLIVSFCTLIAVWVTKLEPIAPRA
jgi:hypothetical protein